MYGIVKPKCVQEGLRSFIAKNFFFVQNVNFFVRDGISFVWAISPSLFLKRFLFRFKGIASQAESIISTIHNFMAVFLSS